MRNLYKRPRVRIIDLCEEVGILVGSQSAEKDAYTVNSDYAEKALGNKKGGIWKTDSWLSD